MVGARDSRLLTTCWLLSTGDSWVSTSWTGMLARGTAACLYFITWIVIGNFVLLTLFLAILITNFQVRAH